MYVLRSMGHGDTLIISDVNFPSKSIAKETVHGDLLRMENITSPDAIKAILTVLPLDTFVEEVVSDKSAQASEALGACIL